MSWNPGAIQDLTSRWRYAAGRVGTSALRALIDAVTQNQPSFNQGEPALSSLSGTQTWTNSLVLRASPGRLYLVRAENTDTNAVNVILYDSTSSFPIGGCTVPAQIAASGSTPAVPGVAEVAFFASPNGAGQNILTSLIVRAVRASDGSTAATTSTLTVTALTSA
jgi:hypothetical protein